MASGCKVIYEEGFSNEEMRPLHIGTENVRGIRTLSNFLSLKGLGHEIEFHFWAKINSSRSN
jgi:hypothetical protein